jgi:hypothetical protein
MVKISDVVYFSAACDADGWPRVWCEIMDDGSARAVHNSEIGPGVYAPRVNGRSSARTAHEAADGFFVEIISTHSDGSESENVAAALRAGMQWLDYDGDTCPDHEEGCDGCDLDDRCPYCK